MGVGVVEGGLNIPLPYHHFLFRLPTPPCRMEATGWSIGKPSACPGLPSFPTNGRRSLFVTKSQFLNKSQQAESPAAFDLASDQ